MKRNISRKAEEAYLAETLRVVRDNVREYGQEIAKMQEDIDEMLEHYHDNDAEVLTILNNTVTMHTHMKRALERNEKALKKPYFGRIVFHDEALNKEESLYIGRGGIAKDTTHQMVTDWRAPVANAYYENGLGKCSYPVPDGQHMEIELLLKRTYEIEDAKLIDYYDSEVVANSSGRDYCDNPAGAERNYPEIALSQHDRAGCGRLWQDHGGDAPDFLYFIQL